MKKVITASLLLVSQFSFSQNLVPNPSFEQFDTCPDLLNQVNRCLFWHSAGTSNSSPDYFNTCSNAANISPPSVAWGYQFPNSGNAYCFTESYYTLSSNAREFIQTQLTQSLVLGQRYYVSLYLNLPGGTSGVSIGTNKFGALFTTYTFSSINSTQPLNFAHIYSDSILTDTINWYHLRGSFIADSAYQFITIGNFFDDQHTDTIMLNGLQSQTSGYFIDDVCVSTDSLLCSSNVGIREVAENNKIIVFPNPSFDFFRITGDVLINNISVFNFIGELIEEKNNLNSNQFNINCMNWGTGIYFIKVNNAFLKQLIIH